MAKIYEFPSPKKEVREELKNEPVEEIDFSSIEERTAINILSRERYDFVLNIKRNNPGINHTDAYKDAYNLLVGSSRVDIANMINRDDLTESDINLKPAYYIAAFNILCDTV